MTYTGSWLLRHWGHPFFPLIGSGLFYPKTPNPFLSPHSLWTTTFFSSPSRPRPWRVVCAPFPTSSRPTHSSALWKPRLVSTLLGWLSKGHCNLRVAKCNESFSAFLLHEFSVLLTELVIPAFLQLFPWFLTKRDIILFGVSPSSSAVFRFFQPQTSLPVLFFLNNGFLRMPVSIHFTLLLLPFYSHPRAILSTSHCFSIGWWLFKKQTNNEYNVFKYKQN